MVNLKYPSGLKGKSYIGWLGGIVGGVSPLAFFFLGGLYQEYQTGETTRDVSGESNFYYNVIAFDYNINVVGRELLNRNPNYPFGYIQRKRLSLDKFENFSSHN